MLGKVCVVPSERYERRWARRRLLLRSQELSSWSSQRARDRVSRFGLDLDVGTALKFEGCFLELALGGSLQPELASNPARFGP